MFKKSLILMIVFSVGTAFAVPTELNQRITYTQTLNPIISSLMSWYGNLIKQTSHNTILAVTPLNKSELPSYPKNITQINILKTEIIEFESPLKNQLKITSKINYKNSDNLSSKIITEVFSLETPPKAPAIIKQVTRTNDKQSSTEKTQEFDRHYFKTREFAYAWLAYLDGIDTTDIIDKNKQLQTANYALKIGTEVSEASFEKTLKTREKYLYQGGHLLRKISIQTDKDNNKKQTMDLIIEWKGINKSGKSVLAKIHQIIELETQEDNSWNIISIKEEHLLPDLAPWLGLLC